MGELDSHTDSKVGDGWFYVEKIGDETHQFFLGYCSWGLGDELEIWVHIDGYDYGYDYGRSDWQLSDEGLRRVREWCAKVCEPQAQAQTTIREDGSQWVLGCKDVELELDLTEHRLDMEEIYGRAMELFGCKMRVWESLASEAQEQALQLVEETRHKVTKELGEEPMEQGRTVSGGLRSPNVQRSPVTREREEDEELGDHRGASAGPHAYPFMGINISRTSVASASAPAKPAPEPASVPEPQGETKMEREAETETETETETDIDT